MIVETAEWSRSPNFSETPVKLGLVAAAMGSTLWVLGGRGEVPTQRETPLIGNWKE